jgi:hypothetical protein
MVFVIWQPQTDNTLRVLRHGYYYKLANGRLTGLGYYDTEKFVFNWKRMLKRCVPVLLSEVGSTEYQHNIKQAAHLRAFRNIIATEGSPLI